MLAHATLIGIEPVDRLLTGPVRLLDRPPTRLRPLLGLDSRLLR